MIAQLTGKVAHKGPEEIVVDVHGVGYHLFVPLSTYLSLPEVGDRATLLVHTLVREDALQLFGFFTEEERHLFRLLLTVQKVGPRLAIASLSALSCEGLVSAIRGGDVGRLATIPGIGRKTAERLVLELKERVESLSGTATTARPSTSLLEEDARSALANLGYRPAVVDKALAAVQEHDPPEHLEDWIRLGLAALAR